MKRFLITNRRNGLVFQRTGESFERQPEYGPPAGVRLKSECHPWELDNGTSAGVNEEGHELWSFPDSMELQEFDMTAELAAEAAKKEARAQRLERLKAANPAAANSVAALRVIVADILEELKERP